MNMQTVIILTISAFLAAVGQIFFKLGSSGRVSLVEFVNTHNVLGGVMYISGTCLWLYGLSRSPLHLVYPFTMLTFFMVIAFSVLVAGEQPTFTAMLGFFIIGIGLSVVWLGS
jgi:drug/metabolite transporter (DMT)-like permease